MQCKGLGTEDTQKTHAVEVKPNKSYPLSLFRKCVYFRFLSLYAPCSLSLPVSYHTLINMQDVPPETLPFSVTALNVELEELWAGKDEAVPWLTDTVLQVEKLSIRARLVRIPENSTPVGAKLPPHDSQTHPITYCLPQTFLHFRSVFNSEGNSRNTLQSLAVFLIL